MLQKRLSPTAKRFLIVGAVIGTLALLYNVRTILGPFIIALVMAYVLNPLVEALVRMTRRSRLTVVAVIYLALTVALVWSIILLPPAIVRQIRAINIDLEAIGAQMRQILNDYQYIAVAGYTIDLQGLTGEIRSLIQTTASFVAGRTGGVVMSILSGLAWGILTLLVSFYLLKDAPKAVAYIHNALPEAYRDDYVRLTGEINAVLSSYLRGQVILGLTVGVVTAIALSLLGVRNAILFGVLAGLLEVIPNIGPVVASVPAIASAFFQGSSRWPIENHWFALVVLLLYVVIQQLENNLLVPRIIGSSVKLHPVIVIFGLMAGATMAGVLGALLAVPAMTIGRILIAYLGQKLTE